MSKRLSDEAMTTILNNISLASDTAMDDITSAIAIHPEDARLHFLKGSLLIERGQHIEAHTSLKNAVVLDPNLHIARFQLGFFQLTSGESDAARETWQPLGDQLPEDHYMRSFLRGLLALIVDDFRTTITELQTGIAQNTENDPLNNDMSLIISECEKIVQGQNIDNDGEEASATSFLLQRSMRGQSIH